ncbi:MAG: three-Cys-motif partner protein TcmP [Gammaproteobacteria bacterium]|nr:three-Cys-motif partner protein TcmP [Gammaproteobacteria bacterium]MDE0226363.1 three-Cys-motif partner protein TcmP [Gammaproteobacteria bacterium]
MSFKWHPDEPPPQIEPHSKAKLTVLRSYLRAYFDRLNVNPQREEFKLDLVDGFAGGGVFTDGNATLSGTPIIMLEETAAARERLNEGRVKPLNIDCKFYFVDKERAHTDHLRMALREREYRVDGDSIVVQTGLFEDEVERILQSIRQRQPRAGRAIFLLDQTGFSQVELALVSRIFSELPASEVILTFAADALINHLAETPQIAKAVAPLQLTTSQIRKYIEDRDGDAGRALVQRALRDHTRITTGAAYDTPFFIRPHHSRRALWFLHLSRHPTARDVMIQRHWDVQNTFEHYGRGDFGMLGWDALRDSGSLPLFQFRELDAMELHNQLLDSLPRELFALASDQPVTMDAVRHALANRTAARFSDLDQVILQLFREKEFEILNPEGNVRSRALTRLRSTDRIALPSISLLPGLSRL